MNIKYPLNIKNKLFILLNNLVNYFYYFHRKSSISDIITILCFNYYFKIKPCHDKIIISFINNLINHIKLVKYIYLFGNYKRILLKSIRIL